MLQAAGWIALFAVLGVRGNEGLLTWAAAVVFVVVVPFLALWPPYASGETARLSSAAGRR